VRLSRSNGEDHWPQEVEARKEERGDGNNSHRAQLLKSGHDADDGEAEEQDDLCRGDHEEELGHVRRHPSFERMLPGRS